MQTVKTFLKTNFKNNLLTTFTVAILLSVLFVLSTSTQVNAATNTVNILIKNEPVQFTEQTGKPFIDSNNRTLVPMRVVMEKYGCTVDWEQESFSAIVKKGDIVVKVPTKQQFLFVNGSRVDTDTVPQVINGRTYLPVAVVLRAVGADVQWDDKSRSVVVDGVGQGVNPVETVPTAQPTQPAQPITIVPTNSGASISDKPVGYDEFMKGFEVVKIIPREHKVDFIIRNSLLDSPNLENYFKSVPENNLKDCISHLATLYPDYLTYPHIDLWFYSNVTELSHEEGIKGNLWEGRVLISSIIKKNQGETITLFYPNWKEYIGR